MYTHVLILAVWAEERRRKKKPAHKQQAERHDNNNTQTTIELSKKKNKCDWDEDATLSDASRTQYM